MYLFYVTLHNVKTTYATKLMVGNKKFIVRIRLAYLNNLSLLQSSILWHSRFSTEGDGQMF